MAKKYKEWNPNQQFFLPPALQDWLPEDHPVYVVRDVVEQLDISAIEEKYQQKDWRGTRPHPPKMMVSLLLYGYSVGVCSSRKLEKATYEQIPFRVLTAGLHPDHTRISEFRRQHLKELQGLFVQVLMICDRAGLVSLGKIALDGTKVQANASKHKAMSYSRMLQQEERLRKEIEELMEKAEAADEAEDDEFGAAHRGDELPEELQRRKDRLVRIREARQELEKEAKEARAKVLEEQAERARDRAENHDNPTVRKGAKTIAKKRAKEAGEMAGGEKPDSFCTSEGMPKHRPKHQTDGTPKPKAQRNFTDPDSRIMMNQGAFIQGYNCQAAVDEKYQIILSAGVTNMAPDNGNLAPMLTQAIENLGREPEAVLADSGYWNDQVLAEIADHNTEAYIATGRTKGYFDEPVATGEPPQEAGERERMNHKIRTAQGRAHYSRRKVIVEPVFGQIKDARGFRRFLLRGLEKVAGEWTLVSIGHNLRKLATVMQQGTATSGLNPV